MRIGLYGMPTAGKSFIMDRIDFIETISGSKALRNICPEFDLVDEKNKNAARKALAKALLEKKDFIMDGHYAFGDKVAFTEEDGGLYDAFLYLYISADVLRERMKESVKNKKYLDYDISEWQRREIDSLRQYCHEHDKDFYVIDNPPSNVFDDVSQVVEFIKDIVGGYSCKQYASKCTEEIIKKSKGNIVTLMDGDKTITVEDSSCTILGYKTHIYDGNYYSGYQAWKQAKEFRNYRFDGAINPAVTMNETVCRAFTEDTFIVTSGHEEIWKCIAKQLKKEFYGGVMMAAETKFFITKMLQEVGKTVIAYGDSMNDYYMLKQADQGYLVRKKDVSISRSLKGMDLGGLKYV